MWSWSRMSWMWFKIILLISVALHGLHFQEQSWWRQRRNKVKWWIHIRSDMWSQKNLSHFMKWCYNLPLDLSQIRKTWSDILESIFVAASHQTGLDSRSMTQRSIKEGIREGRGQAWAEARALMTMMHLAHLEVAHLKPRALRPQVCLVGQGPLVN